MPDRPSTPNPTSDQSAPAKPAFCNAWPWPNSDLDITTPEANVAVHRARGCCQGEPAKLSVPAEPDLPTTARLRLLRGRMCYVGPLNAEPLGAFLRRLGDAVDRTEAEFCVSNDTITEGVSHVVVNWRDNEGWSGLLVIE